MKAGSKLFGSMFLALCASIGCADLVHAQEGPVNLVTTGNVTYAQYTCEWYGCDQLVGIGPVIRNGSNFSYDFDVAVEIGVPCPLLCGPVNNTVALGTLAPGDYTLTTTSWKVPVATNTFTVPTNSTPMLQPIGFDTNGSFNIQLTGVPNVSYVLQCSTNLVDWTSLSTNSVGSPLRDTSTVVPGPRYYRVEIVNLTISPPTAPPPAVPVGEWLAGAPNFTDVSGYSPAGTHDGFDAAGTGGYWFTNDVPPGQTGVALYLNGTTAIAISNSSTLDASYTNTFDDTIHNAMTVAFWAKGWPGSWNPFVSKNGYSSSSESGWTIRNDGVMSPCFTMRSPGGTIQMGTAYPNSDDMAPTSLTYGNDGKWHYYVGTYNSQTGLRKLIVDGWLVAEESGNGAYNLAPAEHLVIGGRDSPPGNSFGRYYRGLIYDVRIYNTALY